MSIGFFDLLGVRFLAMHDSVEYRKVIKSFCEVTKKAFFSYANPEVDRLFAYSDNAYVQMESVDSMCLFFQLLREDLLYKHIYFSAAVGSGTLEAKSEKKTNKKRTNGKEIDEEFIHMQFLSNSATEIYAQQSRLKGIGIVVDPSIIQSNERPRSVRFCSSYYCPSLESYQLVPYTDIAFSSTTPELVELAISEMIRMRILNKKASRYYISLVITMINSLDLEIFDNEDDWVQIWNSLSLNDDYEVYREYCSTERKIFQMLFLEHVHRYCRKKQNSFPARLNKLMDIAQLSAKDIVSYVQDQQVGNIMSESLRGSLLSCIIMRGGEMLGSK